MLLLTSPSDGLQIITSSAAIINAHASWVDTNTGTGTITPGRTNTAVSAAATTGVAGTPVSGVQRNVKTLHVRNADATLPCDVTVQHTDGTVVAQLYKRTLSPGDMLEYTDQAGFAWTTASGASGGGTGGGGGQWTTGDIRATFKNVADTGWIMADDGSIGNATSGATNRSNADTQALFTLFWNNILQTTSPARTCTISIASPAVVTRASHGFPAGQQVVFSTSGALPTGITAGTIYYVISAGLTAGAFRIATTPGGTAINTSGTQSGTHNVTGFTGLTIQDSTGATVTRGATPAADYAANRRLVLPKMVGRALLAAGAGAGLSAHSVGDFLGAETCTPTLATTASHEHLVAWTSYMANYDPVGGGGYNLSAPVDISTGSAGGGKPFNIMSPSAYVNYMIKL